MSFNLSILFSLRQSTAREKFFNCEVNIECKQWNWTFFFNWLEHLSDLFMTVAGCDSLFALQSEKMHTIRNSLFVSECLLFGTHFVVLFFVGCISNARCIFLCLLLFFLFYKMCIINENNWHYQSCFPISYKT